MIDFEELEKGEILEINGEDFEIMKVIKKTNPSAKPGATLQFFLSIEMKKKESSHIFPTAFLQYFPDTNRLLLVEHTKLDEKDIKLKKK
jgi:hypothetical protein